MGPALRQARPGAWSSHLPVRRRPPILSSAAAPNPVKPTSTSRRGDRRPYLHEGVRMTTATKKRSDVKDPQLAPLGKKRILWADSDMPVLARIRERFDKEKPLARPAHVGLPARHRRDGQPGPHPQGRRRRPGADRLQPAQHPGRRRRQPRPGLRHRRLRHPRARTTTPTTSTSSPPWSTSRTSPWTTAPTWSPPWSSSPWNGSTTCIRRCGPGRRS